VHSGNSQCNPHFHEKYFWGLESQAGWAHPPYHSPAMYMYQVINSKAVKLGSDRRRLTQISQLTCESSCEEASLCRSRMHWLTVFSMSRAVCIASSPLPQLSFAGFCRFHVMSITRRNKRNFTQNKQKIYSKILF